MARKSTWGAGSRRVPHFGYLPKRAPLRLFTRRHIVRDRMHCKTKQLHQKLLSTTSTGSHEDMFAKGKGLPRGKTIFGNETIAQQTNIATKIGCRLFGKSDRVRPTQKPSPEIIFSGKENQNLSLGVMILSLCVRTPRCGQRANKFWKLAKCKGQALHMVVFFRKCGNKSGRKQVSRKVSTKDFE